MPSIIYIYIYIWSWWLTRLKNQYCFVSLFISCLIEQTGCLYTELLPLSIIYTATVAVFVRYSTFAGRTQRYGWFHYWHNTTNCYSCSWFCTMLLEFFSMFLCKISFSASSNAHLLVLQEKVISQKTAFFPRLFYQSWEWKEFVL